MTNRKKPYKVTSRETRYIQKMSVDIRKVNNKQGVKPIAELGFSIPFPREAGLPHLLLVDVVVKLGMSMPSDYFTSLRIPGSKRSAL